MIKENKAIIELAQQAATPACLADSLAILLNNEYDFITVLNGIEYAVTVKQQNKFKLLVDVLRNMFNNKHKIQWQRIEVVPMALGKF